MTILRRNRAVPNGGYMKKIMPILFLLIYLFAFAGPLAAQPKLSIPDSIFDFGFSPQNAKISHKFWLHSTGTDSLKIIKISPG
jgi:hypothetical protein